MADEQIPGNENLGIEAGPGKQPQPHGRGHGHGPWATELGQQCMPTCPGVTHHDFQPRCGVVLDWELASTQNGAHSSLGV